MDSEENKTPRTHDTWKKAYDVKELAKFMVELSQQLERELDIATVNETFAENKVYMLEKQLKQANERIKQRDEWNERLDERIDRLEEKIIFLSEIRQEAGVQDANLREKLSVANERIKQLEKALEATAMIIGPPGHSEWATDDEINRAWGLYIQTKEAKL